MTQQHDGRRGAKRLSDEVAQGSLVSIRQVWDSSSVAAALDPRRLAQLLQSAREGEAHDYLTLAAEMEERDLFYRSLLATRRLAVQGLEPTLTPAGDDQAALDLAEEVREQIVDRPDFQPLLYDSLDGIAKGYAAIEIVWDTSSAPWRPARYLWRDPRWFRWDRDTGQTLRLLTDEQPVDGVDLEPAKWILHTPRSISGLAVRGGIAMCAAYAWLIKSYDLASWAGFIETFGYPLRLGRYGRDATEEDLRILARAVANLGRDVGATIPDSMQLEIVAGVQQGASTDYFRQLAEWVDRQLAVGVLGQVATTEGTPGRLGSDDAQQEVRRDIVRSDARQLASTLQRDLIAPYVALNHGGDVAAPRLRLPVDEPEDVGAIVSAVERLVPLGLRVRTSDLYDRLGLTAPDADDEVLTPPTPQAAGPGAGLQTRGRGGGNARRGGDPDVAADLAELVEGQDWEPITRPIHDAVQAWAERMDSLEEAERRLPELLSELDHSRMVERLAADLLRARGLGDIHFADRQD